MKSGWIPMLRSSLTECCVGFVLSSSDARDVGHERDVDVADVLAAEVLAHLADRLEERQALDVADGAADLGDDDVGLLLVGATPADAVLDLVRDVRDDLDGARRGSRRGAPCAMIDW